jgi:hypothetical protein
LLHELGQCLSQSWFASVEITNKILEGLGVLMTEASKMSKVNIHGLFFLLSHLLRLMFIVIDGLTVLPIQDLLSVGNVILVCSIEFEVCEEVEEVILNVLLELV